MRKRELNELLHRVKMMASRAAYSRSRRFPEKGEERADFGLAGATFTAAPEARWSVAACVPVEKRGARRPTRDHDAADLERLAERLEHPLRELPQLVQRRTTMLRCAKFAAVQVEFADA